MKKTFLLNAILMLLWMIPESMNAQTFSAWSVDPGRPNLKARYQRFSSSDGYDYIKLEISSSRYCTMQITSTLCNYNNKDINGWKQITLYSNRPKVLYFKIRNTCANGWWWWYRYYRQGQIMDFDNGQAAEN